MLKLALIINLILKCNFFQEAQNLSMAENQLKEAEDLISQRTNELAILKKNLVDKERERYELKNQWDKLDLSLRESYIQVEGYYFCSFSVNI